MLHLSVKTIKLGLITEMWILVVLFLFCIFALSSWFPTVFSTAVGQKQQCSDLGQYVEGKILILKEYFTYKIHCKHFIMLPSRVLTSYANYLLL